MTKAIDYGRRVARLRSGLKEKKLDSLLVTSEHNVRYLSGFTGHDSFLLITQDKKFFITDSRYIEEAKDTIKGFDIKLVNLSTYRTIAEAVKEERLRKVGFESMNIPFNVGKLLGKYIGDNRIVSTCGFIEAFRTIKDALEIKFIRNSISLTKKVFNRAIKLVRPGISEESIARAVEMEFIKNGSDAAFDPIVASGKNTSRPHAMPTHDRIEDNTVVMLDIGCSLDGYNSDMTRMIFLGHVKEQFKKIYGIVSAAQAIAIDMIKPGSVIADIDLAARSHIDDKGYGKFFGHSLGHGVGLEVHDEPSISKNNDNVLKTGMVFTVEPAIYIPKFGGVRIEDMVLVTDNGCEVLTR